MIERAKPTEKQILSWHKSLSNWGRWGPDDERGTLNLITERKREPRPPGGSASSSPAPGRSITSPRAMRRCRPADSC